MSCGGVGDGDEWSVVGKCGGCRGCFKRDDTDGKLKHEDVGG